MTACAAPRSEPRYEPQRARTHTHARAHTNTAVHVLKTQSGRAGPGSTGGCATLNTVRGRRQSSTPALALWRAGARPGAVQHGRRNWAGPGRAALGAVQRWTPGAAAWPEAKQHIWERPGAVQHGRRNRAGPGRLAGSVLQCNTERNARPAGGKAALVKPPRPAHAPSPRRRPATVRPGCAARPG